MGDKYPGKKYDFTKNIPYANSEEWGLRGRKWEKISQIARRARARHIADNG